MYRAPTDGVLFETTWNASTLTTACGAVLGAELHMPATAKAPRATEGRVAIRLSFTSNRN